MQVVNLISMPIHKRNIGATFNSTHTILLRTELSSIILASGQIPTVAVLLIVYIYINLVHIYYSTNFDSTTLSRGIIGELIVNRSLCNQDGKDSNHKQRSLLIKGCNCELVL